MWLLRIDHETADYDRWKSVFDSDPVGRRDAGVRTHRVMRRRDNPNHVAIDLEFDSAEQAAQFHERLKGLWERVEAEGMITGPVAVVVEVVEETTANTQ
jgi:hypothetical protein